MDGRPNRRNKAAFSNPSAQCTAEVEVELGNELIYRRRLVQLKAVLNPLHIQIHCHLTKLLNCQASVLRIKIKTSIKGKCVDVLLNSQMLR